MRKKFLKKIFTVMMAAVIGAACLPATSNAAGAGLKGEVNSIIAKATSEKDSKSAKLKKLFKHVEGYDYGRTVGFAASDGWTGKYALEMYRDKKGSCYHYAAAFAYLAKKATGYTVRVVIGETETNPRHAWTEVKIKGKWYIFDTNRDKFEANSSLKYYMKKKTGREMKDAYGGYKNAVYYKIKL